MTINNNLIEVIRLKTIANLPYFIHGIEIIPKNLKSIIEDGYETYNRNLGILTVQKEDVFPPQVMKELPSDITLLQLMRMSHQYEYVDLIVDSIRYFTDTDKLDLHEDVIRLGDVSLPYSSLEDMLQVIRVQNCIHRHMEDEQFRPLNERARLIQQKMLANKKKIQELKKSSSNDEQLTLLDLISILVSNANGINLFNVFDLNMFQFNDQFNRMKMIDEYEINIQALLHGADSNHINIKHWMSKI
ncbi:hypothetical protein MH117_03090 [Paenibacillus sp. ACRRX]|uniref:hypothetical protein n=1 Tax=unclassified Paenibacillus TaxID=185978 RepID=UPI001EF7461A|nr:MULTISPECIES: hypothetical protein [unclassified Paenibacillus]MCG7406388.1 hypothetical protein [Paenibacillus sp. ACRRX]MDK8179418.1 hypothetical protein [Paenibacillus sp. UMB4589-SE434]